jgi:hypothetical protein
MLLLSLVKRLRSLRLRLLRFLVIGICGLEIRYTRILRGRHEVGLALSCMKGAVLHKGSVGTRERLSSLSEQYMDRFTLAG